MAKHYDVVIIGAGPGGYTAAMKAADVGISVDTAVDIAKESSSVVFWKRI
mgnify:CR=1 FL=1